MGVELAYKADAGEDVTWNEKKKIFTFLFSRKSKDRI